MAAHGRNLTAPLGAEGDVDVGLDGADGQFESHEGGLGEEAEGAADETAALNAFGAESQQHVTGRHVGAETDRQGQGSNELGDGLDEDHSGHEDVGSADGHQVSQHILGGVGPAVDQLRRPNADGQTREDRQNEGDGRRRHGNQVRDETGQVEDQDGDHQRWERSQSQLRLLFGVEGGIHPQIPNAGSVAADDRVVGVAVTTHEEEAAVGVVFGQATEDELLGLFFGLLVVAAKRIDAVGSSLRGHQRREKNGAAHGERVEQSRGADGIETHEDVALLGDAGGVDDGIVAEDGLGQQRRRRLGCLKLVLAQIGQGAKRFLTRLKLLTINSREKSTLSRENSCRESCHFLLIKSDVAPGRRQLINKL